MLGELNEKKAACRIEIDPIFKSIGSIEVT